MNELFADSIAFAGAKMIRRVLGLAHVEDLESIQDPERRATCEKNVLNLGRDLLLGASSFSDIADVIGAAMITAQPNH
jgi:5-methylthioribose kinase